MAYWLFKSEPRCFSLDDLSRKPKQTTCWDGVRNYQARNMLRDQIHPGDQVFFYHSNCTPPGIAGIVEVVSDAYADATAWDIHSDHYDPGSTPENPRWFMVDVKFLQKFPRLISLDEIKAQPKLASMLIVRKGNRLSVTPVTDGEWKTIVNMV